MSHSASVRRGGKWTPKLLLCLPTYHLQDFVSDLIAGITVGLVALPLAMAFGIASGVTPQAGIYTAIVAGFLISALGGSRLQIGGPTGAFVVIISGIIGRFGLSGLLMVTMMAGVMLVLMGVTGLGTAVKFIPRPVTIGFTNGIALLIASTQIKDFLGLRVSAVPSEFLGRMEVIGKNLGTLHLPTIAVSTASLLILLTVPRLTRKLPGSILALLLGTVTTAVFSLPVETIGSRFGGIPTGLPPFSIPTFQPSLFLPLLPSAFTVAMLAAVESLLSAVVADSMTGDRHNSNMELIAQGIANIATPLFGGMPATGAIARTATNIRSGARSPVAGMVHALTLLFILLVAAPLVRYIPLATLAAVLFVVAYNMGEWKEIAILLKHSRADQAVWIVTFALTVFADLTVAVEIGLGLAALLYIYRISQTTTVARVTAEYIQAGNPHSLQGREIPSYVSILRIHGPFLFGTTDKLAEETLFLDTFESIVILRLRNMTAVDATGLYALEVFAERLKKVGKTLLLCGARDQPRKAMMQTPFLRHIGRENILPHVEAALRRAEILWREKAQQEQTRRDTETCTAETHPALKKE
jgi:SulP family sulfate permease